MTEFLQFDSWLFAFKWQLLDQNWFLRFLQSASNCFTLSEFERPDSLSWESLTIRSLSALIAYFILFYAGFSLSVMFLDCSNSELFNVEDASFIEESSTVGSSMMISLAVVAVLEKTVGAVTEVATEVALSLDVEVTELADLFGLVTIVVILFLHFPLSWLSFSVSTQ